jgi:hypothetical protein
MKPDLKGLMKLGRYLQRVPRQQFNQGYWWSAKTGKKKSECGTTGCVAGHAVNAFPHRFKRSNEDSWTDDDGTTYREYGVEHRRTGLRGTEGFAAGFKLSFDDAYMITQAEADHQTPKAAAKAIFRLVDRLKQETKR